MINNKTLLKMFFYPLFALLLFYQFNCTSSLKPIRESGPIENFRTPSSNFIESSFYTSKVQPILNNRCVACHTCNEAPCQLRLDSYAALLRGISKHDMGFEKFGSSPTRMKDYSSLEEWRKRGFFPVIPDRPEETSSSESKNPTPFSLLLSSLNLGRANTGEFSLETLRPQFDGTHTCPTNEKAFKEFAKTNSSVGMPMGFPSLNEDDYSTLQKWGEMGFPAPSSEELESQNQPTPEVAQQIQVWEDTFHQSNKSQLMARYIYEHVFTTHIHFKNSPYSEWYELVRSYTAHPSPIEEIVTPRPMDPPPPPKGQNSFSGQVYYRFKRITSTLARTSHIPWELDEKMRKHLVTLFLQPPWPLRTPDPSDYSTRRADVVNPLYDKDVTNPLYTTDNPFIYFDQIPAKIRYQFLLENSLIITNGMIRGPVCSGRIATNAIRDHFWVYFIKPESDVTVFKPEIGEKEWISLNDKPSTSLTKFAASPEYVSGMKYFKPEGFSTNDIWTGFDNDPNASLTILRHETSASVHHGQTAGLPKTVWILNFSNFERIYYNLVAEYKHWGSTPHKVSTWVSMSLHRSEAEERFISFLPLPLRSKVHDEWNQGAGGFLQKFLTRDRTDVEIPANVTVTEKSPVKDLIIQLQDKFSKKQINIQSDSNPKIASWDTTFQEEVTQSRPPIAAVKFFPDIVYLKISDTVYTLLNHRSFKFNNVIAGEKFAYEKEKNIIALVPGLLGDRPEYFVELKEDQLHQFISDLQNLQNYPAWVLFKNKYFIRRNNPQFWSTYDWFNQWQREHHPEEPGVIDLREYDRQSDEERK